MDVTATSHHPEIVVAIPARYASSRFPGKPLAEIDGMTMIHRVYHQCMMTKRDVRVVVATDDERIAAEVRSFHGAVIMTPESCASGTERIAHVMRELPADIYVNVQGDEPLMDPTTIDATIDVLLSDDDIDISTACCPLTSHSSYLHPNTVKVVMDGRQRALYFSRAPIPYDRDSHAGHVPIEARKHIGIYAYRAAALRRFVEAGEGALERIERLEQLRALTLGLVIGVANVSADTQAVDSPEDIERVLEFLAHRRDFTAPPPFHA